MFQFSPGPLSQDAADKLTELLQDTQSGSKYGASFLGDDAPDNSGGSYTNNIVPNDPFPVKLTDVTDGLYTWTEQLANGPADYSGWIDLPGGRSGNDTLNPAYTANDETIDVSNNPVVWIQRAYFDNANDPADSMDWIYVITSDPGAPETFSLTVKESDGSPICNDVNTIVFNSVYDTVSCGNNGVTTINPNPPMLRGTLTGNLSFGGNTTMNIAEGGNTTVYDWVLSSGQNIANGTHVLAFLDQDGKYYVGAAQCP